MKPATPEDLRRTLHFLPGLEGQFRGVPSASTRRYNCVAWALHGERGPLRWWEPPSQGEYAWRRPWRDYWPRWAPPTDLFAATAFAHVFVGHGYERCDDPSVEEGFDKLAMFVEGDSFYHVARQLPDGWWTSKLGEHIDVEHATLQAIIHPDELASTAFWFFRRPVQSSPVAPRRKPRPVQPRQEVQKRRP